MLSGITSLQKRTLVAASLGWMLDAMDVMLYAMALTSIQREFHMSSGTTGLLMSLTLAASAVGGLLFGVIADRAGRTRALMGSILVYSVFTGASGLARSVVQLAVFRTLLGLGMGGEWATGAALVSETWPAEHRGKALGIVQSSWAIGYALAALITLLVLPRFGWRAVFFVGVIPALTVFWIFRHVPESDLWQISRHNQAASPAPATSSTLMAIRQGGGTPFASTAGRLLAQVFAPGLRRSTIIVTAMNAATMFAYWGLFTWIPGYLSKPAAEGGRGLDIVRTGGWVILMQAGTWLGYVSFGFIADRVGRVKTYAAFLLIAAALVPLYGAAHSPAHLLLLGPLVGFFGSGYFSGFGAIASELFPTRVRGTAMGFAYNIGRGLSAAAPWTIGRLAQRYGVGTSLLATAAAFLLAAVISSALPETRGKALE